MSQLIEVTPGSLKSKRGNLKPASSIKMIRNPPKQASTCSGILYFTANFDSSSIGSITPTGKFGAEPTILIESNIIFEKKLIKLKTWPTHHACV